MNIESSLLYRNVTVKIWDEKPAVTAQICAVWLNTHNPKHPDVEVLVKTEEGALYTVRAQLCTVLPYNDANQPTVPAFNCPLP